MWAKIDDRLHSHPKARKAGLEAMGLWTLALSFCSAHLTDGRVELGSLSALTGNKVRACRLAGLLVQAGLWDVHPDGGWQFHDYLELNPSRGQIVEERRIKAEAGRKGGQVTGARTKAAAEARASTGPQAPAQQPGEPPSRPVPSRPVPKEKQSATPSDGMDPEAFAMLERMRSHASLRAVATQPVAEQLLGLRQAIGLPLAKVLDAIDEAASAEGIRAAAEGPMSPGALAKFVSGCVRKGPIHAPSAPAEAPRAPRKPVVGVDVPPEGIATPAERQAAYKAAQERIAAEKRAAAPTGTEGT